MKQLLIRVDDEVHARLRQRAKDEGRSVNALLNELVLIASQVDRESARDRIRSRAAAMGMLSVIPPAPLSPPLSLKQYRHAIDGARGWGQTIDDILDEDRERL